MTMTINIPDAIAPQVIDDICTATNYDAASCREPDQTELSFSTMRSTSTPPNIIAPSRPFPSGEDSVKFFAAVFIQMTVSGVPIDNGWLDASAEEVARITHSMTTQYLQMDFINII